MITIFTPFYSDLWPTRLQSLFSSAEGAPISIAKTDWGPWPD